MPTYPSAGLTACLLASAVGAWGHEGPHKAEPGLMLTQSQALEDAFAGFSVERRTSYLTKEQIEQVSALSGCRHESAVVSYYLARSTAGLVGAAFFESHRLRDGTETIMAVLAPDGRLMRSEILSFHEPADYLPPKGWRASLLGRTLSELERVKGPSGGRARVALSAKSFLEGVRRLMAVYEVAVKEKI